MKNSSTYFIMILLVLFNSHHLFGGTIKELEFNWNSSAILWEGRADFVPCLESFNLKVTNCPEKTTSVTVKFYSSTGKNYFDLGKGDLIGVYTAQSQSSGTFTVLVATNLSFHRFFYVDVFINSPSTGKKQTKVYSTPLKSETSRLEFYGCLSAIGFGQSKLSNLRTGAGFATGLKFKIRPVSTNPNIGRFGLYPRASKWSFVVGTVINELKYKNSDIKSLIFGIKPVIGIDWEFSESLGAFAGIVFGKQDTNSKVNSDYKPVAGISIGLTFSANVFKAFSANIPASQNFPSLENKN